MYTYAQDAAFPLPPTLVRPVHNRRRRRIGHQEEAHGQVGPEDPPQWGQEGGAGAQAGALEEALQPRGDPAPVFGFVVVFVVVLGKILRVLCSDRA